MSGSNIATIVARVSDLFQVHSKKVVCLYLNFLISCVDRNNSLVSPRNCEFFQSMSTWMVAFQFISNRLTDDVFTFKNANLALALYSYMIGRINVIVRKSNIMIHAELFVKLNSTIGMHLHKHVMSFNHGSDGFRDLSKFYQLSDVAVFSMSNMHISNKTNMMIVADMFYKKYNKELDVDIECGSLHSHMTKTCDNYNTCLDLFNKLRSTLREFGFVL